MRQPGGRKNLMMKGSRFLLVMLVLFPLALMAQGEKRSRFPGGRCYLFRLTLADKQGVVSENTYIMGSEEKVEKTAVGKFSALLSLPKADVEVTERVGSKADVSNVQTLCVTLRNKSKVPAPFLRLNLIGEDGEQILPVVYSDNYVTLMPNEQKTVTVSWKRQDARGLRGHIVVEGLQ